MSYAVMPLSDYKAACDKVREKVDLTTVRFEETDFGYLRSEVFTVPKDGVYIFSFEFSDSSKFVDLYFAYPEWEGESSPGYFEPIDSNSAKTTLYTGGQYRIFITDSLGLTPKDILKASLLLDEEMVVDFVPPPKIKSGELAEKVDEVYMAGASDFGLKGKGQGELVTLNNVHPIEHKVEVGVRSKNLWNTETTVSGWIEADKGSLMAADTTRKELSIDFIPCVPSQTYTMQTILTELPPDHQWCCIAFFDSEKNIISRPANSTVADTLAPNYVTATAPTNAAYMRASARTYGNAKLQLEVGTTATTYAPFVADFSDCKVTTSGKNLFNEDKANITKTEDYFKSNVSYWQSPCFTIPVESGATYKCSCEYYTPNVTNFNTMLAYSISIEKTYTSAAKALAMRLKTQSSTDGYYRATDTFTVPDGIEEVYFIADNEGVGTFFKKFQIEKGTTATEYEPYIGAEYTAAADGTVEGVKSISPVMNLMADKAGAVIDAECFLDPEAVITDLTNTVITLGGEI